MYTVFIIIGSLLYLQEPMQQEGEGGQQEPRPDGPEAQQHEAMDQWPWTLN